jgi:transcriptional regulator with GAF, ATPase, and Fis domain
MLVDEKGFFREATLKICGNLEIEKAMCSCVRYLRSFMPVDTMYLDLYERDIGAMRIIAKATAKEGRKLDILAPLPEDAKAVIHGAEAAIAAPDEKRPLKDIWLINRPETVPTSRAMQRFFGEPESSSIVMLLIIEDKPIGFLIVLAEGKDRYTQEHAHLLSLLKEPFYIALSNTLMHREVLLLKERLADDNRYLHSELLRLSGEDIVGGDFGLKIVMEMIRQVAPLDSPVLLLGETGTGKELIASAIHNASSRREGPFIKVNCGAIPHTLMDSELFGHEKGAFTGAHSQKRGRFERAHGGTIFLDEIGELPLDAQIRLLRVLQEKEIERVGGSKPIKADIRTITATHRDLEAMVREGRFREDLYFRLQVFPITIPPLRERQGDIPALVHHFIRKKSREMKLSTTPTLAHGAIERLMTYQWPGNVRELENLVERALILSRGESLTFSDLHPPVPQEIGQSPAPIENETMNLNLAMARHIRRTLEMTGGKVEGREGAAELLGINPGTLRHRMRKLGIPFGRGVRKRQGVEWTKPL